MGNLSRGRPPALLKLNDQLTVLAVDIQPNQIVVAAVDLNGHLLTYTSQFLSDDRALATASTVEALKQLKASCPGKLTVGIGISVPGRVDPKSQRLVFAPKLTGFPTNLKQAIEEEMGSKRR
jgi:predicted NBD/HSP70 family sugar kinase